MRSEEAFYVPVCCIVCRGVVDDQADDTMVKRLKTLNACLGCDLTGADLAEVHLEYVNLKGANFAGADLTGVNLKDAYSITGAKFCSTMTPWGLDNSGCKKK